MFRFEFFVDDKHVTDILRVITGKAKNMQCTPVINAVTTHAGVVKAVSPDRVEAFIRELETNGIKEFNAKEARTAALAVGFSSTSAYHAVKMAIKRGVVKRKPGTEGAKLRYIYVGESRAK